MSTPSRFRTGEYLIDLGAREIHRDGHPVELEAKVFDLIAVLLQDRDRALSKRELNAVLWGDRPVTDAALSQQLRKARRALGDDGDAQRVIRTVHGRGLRWVAPVTAEADADETAPPSSAAPLAQPNPPVDPPPATSAAHGRRYLAVAFAAVLLLAAGLLWRQAPSLPAAGPPQRIAVLPVVDRSGDATLAWTRNGLMGLMTSLFGQPGKAEIAAAASVQAVVGDRAETDAASLQTLRRALGATHFLASELRRLGPVYELDVRLIADGGAERRDTLHGSEPAALAADAVARVRRWLDLEAPPPADVGAAGRANPFIAEAYARGLDAQLRGDAATAKKYFAICLDHDPGLAWARLGLATAQARSGEAAESRDNAGKVAAAARERGDAELLAVALKQLASLAFARGDLDAAAALLDEALAQLPAKGQPLALIDLLVAYGSIEDERGRFAESRRHFERALELARAAGSRRGEALVLVNLASLDNGAGDAAAASTALRTGLDAARAAGDAYLEGATLGNLGATEANQGRLLDASALFKQAIALARTRGDLNLQMLTGTQLIWTLAPFERREEARELAAQVLAAAEREKNPYWQAEARWALAGLAARRHDWPRAFEELDQARRLYAEAAIERNVVQVLADTVATAAQAGDAPRAQAAANEFRRRTANGAEAAHWRAWQPLIAALERGATGDVAGAADDLARLLDTDGHANGAVAQAALFQLGRWQLALDRPADLLARPQWKPWLEQHPDAIALRIAALRATGRHADADAEQARLDQLTQSPELEFDARWLAAF
ncbi:tetratricopeptide repeat protein [Dokdonella sp.]|uniref:tetratricopeptide repeat protein n=1 Tax=Dokdonella sp. TaxID=2291710 RepID=UPI001B21AB8B|nr:tetratricopeptide repeat protein [Dokdonella sp.]MBO9663583.1 tetratricopeptide repeat protein [Dokdonella sp.]